MNKSSNIKKNESMMKDRSGLSRRSFLASCGSCAACAFMTPLSFLDRHPGESPVILKNNEKALKIRVIYSLHGPVQNQPDWPNVGFDFVPYMNKFTGALQKNFGDISFIPSMATGAAEAEKIVVQDTGEPVDGYIVFQMNCWNDVVQKIAATSKPVLYVDFQFGGSGGFLSYNAAFMRAGASNVGFVASSRIDDLMAAVKCFRQAVESGISCSEAVKASRTGLTPAPGTPNVFRDDLILISPEEAFSRLKKSRILAVRDQNAMIAEPIMGIPLEYIAFSEVNDAWSKADRDEARSIAGKWQKNAEDVINVAEDTLETSAAMYLGMKKVLKDHDANAITINCLGGFYGGYIHAYPCLGFHELNNEGLVGACECDINSTATMLAFSTLAGGRPGYISDPVIDTSRRQIIYAHCVASNRVFGPKGPANPFFIMTHSEDRQGASVRSIMPVNYLTTSLQVNQDRKEILLHQAVALDNDPDDRACRTKLCAEPKGDIEKLFTMWDKWGWQRVTFYGDLKDAVCGFSDASGWKVVEEA